MTNEEQMALLMTVFNAIFTSKAQGTDITGVVITHPNLMVWQNNQWQPSGGQAGRWFVDGKIRGFDLDLNLGARIINIRVLEQNPEKRNKMGQPTKPALRAMQGSKIVWVIDRKVDNGGFLGGIENGQWTPSQPRATYPADAPPSEYKAGAQVASDPSFVEQGDEVVDINDLPDIPDGAGIPDSIIQHFADEGDIDVTEY